MTIVRETDAEPLNVLGERLRLLLRSNDSPFRVAAMTVDVPAGSELPPHTHRVEEESYYILGGELWLTVGEAEHRLRPGDFAHVPPGVAHGYRNPGPDVARFLAWTVGGPLDEFFVQMSERVRALPQDAPVMHELTSQYGIGFVMR